MDSFQISSFVPGGIYVAKGMIDVCMRVVNQSYKGSERIRLKVDWYYQRSGRYIVEDKVEVQTKDLYRWSMIAL